MRRYYLQTLRTTQQPPRQQGASMLFKFINRNRSQRIAFVVFDDYANSRVILVQWHPAPKLRGIAVLEEWSYADHTERDHQLNVAREKAQGMAR